MSTPPQRRLKRNRSLIVAAIVAFALVVSTCDGSGPTTIVVHHVDDVRSFLTAGMANDGLPVEIIGQPFQTDADDLTRRVMAALQTAASWTATPKFRTVPPGSTASSRLVFVFDEDRDACRASDLDQTHQPEHRIRLQLALCDEDRSLVLVKGRLNRPSDPSDPAFDALLRQAAHDLFDDSHRP